MVISLINYLMVWEKNEFENCHMKYSVSTLSVPISLQTIEQTNILHVFVYAS